MQRQGQEGQGLLALQPSSSPTARQTCSVTVRRYACAYPKKGVDNNSSIRCQTKDVIFDR